MEILFTKHIVNIETDEHKMIKKIIVSFLHFLPYEEQLRTLSLIFYFSLKSKNFIDFFSKEMICYIFVVNLFIYLSDR